MVIFTFDSKKEQTFSFCLFFEVHMLFLHQTPMFSLHRQLKIHRGIKNIIKEKSFLVVKTPTTKIRGFLSRNHPYITSAKKLGGWGQKNGKFW